MTSIADTYQRIGLSPSPAQLAFAKLALGEPLTQAELEIATSCTGRTKFPGSPFQEVDGICGRKSGKTEYVAAPVIVHRAVSDQDQPGTYLLCAPSKSDQARIGWAAITRQLEKGFPGLIAETKEAEGWIRLRNGNEIKIAWAQFRYLRAPRYKVVCVDEAAFFVSDDPELGFSNPLAFILDSVVGGMVSTMDPLLMLLTTPWTDAGIVAEHYRERDKNPDRLVWRAPTLVMNPSANQVLMERHRRDRGENFYRREYLAEFASPEQSYIDPADIDAAIAPQPFFPIRPNAGYVMALDPGRKRDFFGAAIAHREGDAVVVSWAAEWKPGLFGLKYADVLPEIWAKCREYRIGTIFSDQTDFGGIQASIPTVDGTPEFEMQQVSTGGQSGAELCDVSRALFAQRNLILPNVEGLADEFKRLNDVLTAGGGRDIRAKRGHDDRSRAVMLAVHQAYTQPVPVAPWVEFVSLNPADAPQRSLLPDWRTRAPSPEYEEHLWKRIC